LYVEDQSDDWKDLNDALKKRSKQDKSTPLSIKWAKDPKEVKSKLTLGTKLILADVYFPIDSEEISEDDGHLGEVKTEDRLDEVIRNVQEWSKDQKILRPLPIIAYTSRGEHALERCLRKKGSLYDIWDKSSASTEYVAWRLTEIAKELSRIRPDARTQQLIREMKGGASWHEDVIDMTRQYESGWTEYDQIDRAGVSIQNIAYKIGIWKQCEPLWRVMIEWEALDRAVSRKRRGHARHVINVFWLGYYLIHNKYLRELFTQYWNKLVKNRKNMEAVAEDEPLESLSNAWFIAGLFHDVGGSVEKASEVNKHLANIIAVFGELAPTISSCQHKPTEEFMKMAREWLHDFDEPLISLIEPVVIDGIKKNEPDQGVVGAVHLRNAISTGKQRIYAIEGGRAMSLHNIFPKLTGNTLPVSWEADPLVCLLLLCDQLQTWDRETNSEALRDSDQPTRAELSALTIDKEAEYTVVKMSIDYIAPKHLDHSFELYTRVKDKLREILRKNPYNALDRIAVPWPFKLVVECTLSGEKLTTMEFGEKKS
jgi:hypothetical protein